MRLESPPKNQQVSWCHHFCWYHHDLFLRGAILETWGFGAPNRSLSLKEALDSLFAPFIASTQHTRSKQSDPVDVPSPIPVVEFQG